MYLICYIHRCARQCGGGVFVCSFWFTMTFIQGSAMPVEGDNDQGEPKEADSAVCDMSMGI